MKKIKRVFCALALLGTSIIGICSSNKSNKNVSENASIGIGTNSVEDSESMSGAHGNAKYKAESATKSEKKNSLTTYSHDDIYDDDYGSYLGFHVDTRAYDVTWNEELPESVYVCGKEIGITYINQGKAVTKEKATINKKGDKKYIITYLTAIKMVPSASITCYVPVYWWHEIKHLSCFWAQCCVSARLVDGSKLGSATPENTISDTEYSIGGGIGFSGSGVEASISGSVNLKSRAVEIDNSSNTTAKNVDINIYLNESDTFWCWNWDRYEYAKYEKQFLFAFTVLSDSKEFEQEITISTQYKTMESQQNYVWGFFRYCGFNVSKVSI